MEFERTESVQVFYKEGYVYQLSRQLVANLGITLEKEIRTDYLLVTVDGWLVMRKSYAWNGASSCFNTLSIRLLGSGRVCIARDGTHDSYSGRGTQVV